MSKSIVRQRHFQGPPKSPSAIVKDSIRLCESQPTFRSWGEVDDCLEALRLWEADNEATIDGLRDQLHSALAFVRTITSAGVHHRDDHSANCNWCKLERQLEAVVKQSTSAGAEQ